MWITCNRCGKEESRRAGLPAYTLFLLCVLSLMSSSLYSLPPYHQIGPSETVLSVPMAICLHIEAVRPYLSKSYFTRGLSQWDVSSSTIGGADDDDDDDDDDDVQYHRLRSRLSER